MCIWTQTQWPFSTVIWVVTVSNLVCSRELAFLELKRLRLTETISVHFFGRTAFKNDRKFKNSNGHEKANEGTSRGDTTTNLRDFSPPNFSIPTENFENHDFWRPGRKRDKCRARKPWQLFSENVRNHENRSKQDPYFTLRAENQAFWISKVLPIQWDTIPTPQTSI